MWWWWPFIFTFEIVYWIIHDANTKDMVKELIVNR